MPCSLVEIHRCSARGNLSLACLVQSFHTEDWGSCSWMSVNFYWISPLHLPYDGTAHRWNQFMTVPYPGLPYQQCWIFGFYDHTVSLKWVMNTHRHQHFGCSSEEVNGLLVPPDLNYSPERKTKGTRYVEFSYLYFSVYLPFSELILDILVFLNYKCMHLMNLKWVHFMLSVRTVNIRSENIKYL